jgi:flavin reductase (DIM6/NTAB) family NADH-FMN oxidoreductase RutF
MTMNAAELDAPDAGSAVTNAAKDITLTTTSTGIYEPAPTPASAVPGSSPSEAKIRRKTLRLISNGVYVLTSRCAERYGAATITWVSQASFKPPLIMVAVRRQSNVYQCLAQSRIAALHIVGERQQEIAHRFFFTTDAAAGKINGEPFAEGKTAAPILANLPAHMECHVDQIVDSEGDHAIVILRVVQAECAESVRPLTIAQTPWQYGG